MFHCGPVASSAKHAVNMTFCGQARDTVLTNRQTEKLNFDANYITNIYIYIYIYIYNINETKNDQILQCRKSAQYHLIT